MKITKAKALKIRALAMSSAGNMNDVSASSLPEMFPKLKYNGELVKTGTRINWDGTLKKATVDLWDTVENNPENNPTLWESINYVNGYREIPDTITTTTTFAKGERGWYKGAIWESLYDNNVWSPDQFPAGWQLI